MKWTNANANANADARSSASDELQRFRSRQNERTNDDAHARVDEGRWSALKRATKRAFGRLCGRGDDERERERERATRDAMTRATMAHDESAHDVDRASAVVVAMSEQRASERPTELPVPVPMGELPRGEARNGARVANATERGDFARDGKALVAFDDVERREKEKKVFAREDARGERASARDVQGIGKESGRVANAASVATGTRAGTRERARAEFESDETHARARVRGKSSDRASVSTDSRENEGAGEEGGARYAPSSTNPFVNDDQPGSSTDYEQSDGGLSPRHRRAGSGSGKWSEVSYTTSDDGMLRMCHTSLAPTKPRRWTRGDNLGEGSYGNVWLALNGDTGELFALKEVRVGSGSKHRDESIEQLEQEVNVLSRLVHPNIVRYIGITREETALFIFLEYVPGGSIASLVQRFGKFEENVIRVYTRQILIGLAYLHSQRVVHRDIKGANILVEKSGRIKLADFGMAKVLERVSVGKSFKGSACWMAPEVIRQQNAGFEADIWSVGCTVYEMATGAPPWSNCSTQVQIIFKIASSNDIPDIPEHLSPEGRHFLELCLQRDADLRPDAVTLLDEPFVLDAHKSSEQNVPGLQYDTWASSSQVSYHEDEDVSFPSTDTEPNSRVSSARHVVWSNMDTAP